MGTQVNSFVAFARRRALRLACWGLVGWSAVSAGGCAQPPLFDWGTYEASVYDLYHEEFDLRSTIERLSIEIAHTREKGRRVPPGKLAQLGYLYALAGEMEAAKRSFRAEKEAFPESAIFVDFLLAKIDRTESTPKGGAQ